MICQCGNNEATFSRSGFFRNEQGEREYYEYCNACGDAGPVYVPDVFWDGKPEENLADGADGKPVTFLSRRHKAMYLEERGIYEAGDRFGGAPFTGIATKEKKNPFSKDSVAKARKQVDEMGRDVRRQKVLEIIKKAQEAQR